MPTRRQFLVQASFAALASHTLRSHSQPASSSVDATTPAGTLRGERLAGTPATRVFRGIPYAQPPLGALRFRPPAPLRPWQDIRDATRFALAAEQDGASFPQSEDCLYLNVWTPETPGPHPVLFWIHGGGFLGGRSSEPLFDGTQFTQAGVVVVTVAYRLGAFGFLDMEPILGPTYTGSAVNGLHDLIAALQWTQHNIAALGGDPSRVTIAGESAGAKLADLLLAVPIAAPLFHQVISESGGADRVWPRERSLAAAQGFATQWHDLTQSAPTAIADAPPRQIISVQDSFLKAWPVHFPFRAEIDGTLLPRYPLQSIRAGSARGKRALIGTNRDESAFFLGPHPAHEASAADLGNLDLAQFRRVDAAYRTAFPQWDNDQRRIRSVTAEEYWVPSIRVAEALIAGGAETFVYRFDLPGTGRMAGLTPHASELDLVWDTFAGRQPPAPERALAQQMHAAWVAFIRGLAPGAPGLPSWPAYQLPVRQTMLLNVTSEVQPDPQSRELALWNGLLMQDQ